MEIYKLVFRIGEKNNLVVIRMFLVFKYKRFFMQGRFVVYRYLRVWVKYQLFVDEKEVRNGFCFWKNL